MNDVLVVLGVLESKDQCGFKDREHENSSSRCSRSEAAKGNGTENNENMQTSSSRFSIGPVSGFREQREHREEVPLEELHNHIPPDLDWPVEEEAWAIAHEDE
jgi:hypothetical protein